MDLNRACHGIRHGTSFKEIALHCTGICSLPIAACKSWGTLAARRVSKYDLTISLNLQQQQQQQTLWRTRASYFQCEARTIFPFCLMSWQLGLWLQQLLGDIPANNVQTWHCDYVPVSSRLESCTTGTLLRTLSHIQTIICRQHNTNMIQYRNNIYLMMMKG